MSGLSLVTRRGFLKQAAVAAPVVFAMGGVGGAVEPGRRLNIAGIGIGGMGAYNIRVLAERHNIVALCDLDHDYAAGTIKEYPKAKVYKDYRRMLEVQKDIEAVVIATPDHTHANISLAAIEAGKHVYCQKPLTHDIYESRVLAKAARAAGVTTQMGIQGNSGDGIRDICEWIWDGAIGAVREVDAWCSLSYYPWGHAYWSSPLGERPVEAPPVPEGLDWDLWLGPAPERPYHPTYHPKVWRCWWDFGCGMMGDRGAHTLDSVFKALKLGHPSTVQATVMGGNAEVHPLSAIVWYEFPARGDFPAVTLNWYEGHTPPLPKELEDGRGLPAEGGVLFKGEKGTMMCGVYGDNPCLIPDAAMKAYPGPEKVLPRVGMSHEEDWAQACLEGRQPGANFMYAGPLTEITLLGNVAKRFPERKLQWDGEAMTVMNLPAAQEWVRRPRRAGWEI